MLQIERNGELLNIGYTVKNNLLPSNDEMKRLIKSALYSEGYSRTSTDHNVGTYPVNHMAITRTSKRKLGLFTYGSIDLINDKDEVIGDVDLYKTYSGESTVRGSINLNETFNIVDNDKLKVRLVMDFPTHASAGAIKKIQLRPQNPYNKQYISDSEVYSYRTIYGNESPTSVNDVAILFDNDYNLMVAHKKFINYKGKIYYFSQSENKRIISIGSKFYYFDSIKESTVSITELIFNDSTLKVSKGDSYTFEFSHYSNASYRSYQFVGIKEVEGVLRLCIQNFYSTSYRSYSFIDYDKDTFEYISQTNWSNSNMSESIAPIDKFDLPLCESTGEYRIFKDDSTYYCYNFITKSAVKSSDKLNSMASSTVQIVGGGSNSTRGTFIKPDGTEYFCFKNNQGMYASSGSGDYFNIYEKINEDIPYVPLEIILDEPIIKSPEQTLKLILNIEID